jgi:hypothetical protein
MSKNLYTNSTQYKNWMYSHSHLDEMIMDKYKKIAKKLQHLPDKKYLHKILRMEEKSLQYFIQKMLEKINSYNKSDSLKVILISLNIVVICTYVF